MTDVTEESIKIALSRVAEAMRAMDGIPAVGYTYFVTEARQKLGSAQSNLEAALAEKNKLK